MKTDTPERQSIESFEIRKEIEIAAPIDFAFAAMLDEIGPDNQMPGGKPFPMKIEPWPGGRWYRDLGDNSGHLWGHVQVIKRPSLLEICGPLMMSYPAANHLQYRFKAEGGVTPPGVPPQSHGIDPARTSCRLARGLGILAGAHSRAGGKEESAVGKTMSLLRCRQRPVDTDWSAFANWLSVSIGRTRRE